MTPEQYQYRLSVLEGQLQNLIDQHAKVAAKYGYENRRERQAWLGVEIITTKIAALKAQAPQGVTA